MLHRSHGSEKRKKGGRPPLNEYRQIKIPSYPSFIHPKQIKSTMYAYEYNSLCVTHMCWSHAHV